MFTGIIEGLGTLRSIQPSGQGKIFGIESDFALDGTKIGDSIAVNGACLTAVRLEGRHFSVDVSPETVTHTTFAHAKIGDRVNLERALRLSDRIDGHLVSGHIDGMGIMKDRKILSNAIIIAFSVPEKLAGYMIHKGSVAVDGVSLTINRCDTGSFEVSIIPHTAKLTTVGFKKPGDAVNIETDMIGKYVERFVNRKGNAEKGGSSLNMQFLAKNGFL
ncbi:MAG: riboflavin synthase [Desulfococcaceae bacterium]|jgi:riboflavin synthase|nr:riboflavin synthase [Desulfococcaceae bacterium]